MSIFVPVTKAGEQRAREVLTGAFRELGFTPRTVPDLTPMRLPADPQYDPKVQTNEELVVMAKKMSPFFKSRGISVVDCVFYDVANVKRI